MTDPAEGQGTGRTGGFSGVARKVLERRPLPDSSRELVLVEVTYPPGGTAPVHRHPVPGLIYIVEGIAESAYGDDAPRQYRTGATMQDHADRPHTVFRNVDPERPLRFLAFYTLEPGRPYTMDP